MTSKIDARSFPSFGDMTSGSALAAIFDGNGATTGYAQTTTGYAGLDLRASPHRIDKVRVMSPSNGYDASGLTTPITLTLYAKSGAQPSTSTDGVVLGALSFTDVNAAGYQEISSSDKLTQWDWIWVRGSTGVWTVFAEVEFYAADAPVEPIPYPSKRQVVYFRSCDAITPLPYAHAEIGVFRIPICLEEEAVASIDFQANVKHRGDITGFLGVVGFAFAVDHRSGTTYASLATQPWTPIRNRASGGNIINRDPHHYGAAVIKTNKTLVPGFHEFRVTGSAHSSGAVGVDGLAAVLAENGRGLNGFRITLNKDAVLVEGIV